MPIADIQFYSITSSARPISVLGMLMPSALAVLRLMNSSTFEDCCDWQVSRLLALENPAGIDAGLPERIRITASVADQAPGRGELAKLVDRGHRVTDRQSRLASLRL